MERSAQGLKLSPDEVQALGLRLKRIAQSSMSTELAEIAVGLLSISSHIALLYADERNCETVTCEQYARLHHLSMRTVQWQCATDKLPAFKDESGRWNIKLAQDQ